MVVNVPQFRNEEHGCVLARSDCRLVVRFRVRVCKQRARFRHVTMMSTVSASKARRQSTMHNMSTCERVANALGALGARSNVDVRVWPMAAFKNNAGVRKQQASEVVRAKPAARSCGHVAA